MEKKEEGAGNDLVKALRSSDPKDYIRYWIQANGLVNMRGGLWRYGGAILRYDEVRNKLLVDYNIDRSSAGKRIARQNESSEEIVQKLPPKIAKDLLFAAADEVTRIMKHDMLTALAEKLAFDPLADPNKHELSTFVGNLTGTNTDLSTAAIGHFIHTVKRRILGKPVENHLIVVVIGPQNKGKSENLNRLIGPVNEYRINLSDVAHLTDTRNFHAFSEHYVGVLDEMPRLKQADIGKVKSVVTQSLLSSRTLATHIFTSVPNNLTVIGTSNTRLKFQFLDPTGMRRFYELIVDKEISREISENIDYLKMWKSIDENAPSPITAYTEQLKEHHEDLRPHNTMELFLEEYHIDLTKPLDLKVEVRDVMYNAIREWAKITGNEGPWLREQTMKNMLEEQGLKQHIINGKKIYKVNTDCMLNPLYVNGFSDKALTESDIQEIESLPQLQKMLEASVQKEDYSMAAQIKERMRVIKSKISKGDVFNL